MPDFNSFFQAIAGQESGGNYNAINPSTGAMGKYQILPGNIPGWSAAYLGVSWTPQEFLNDPAKQDALARAVLGNYYQQYGPRGAAAAWYSGNPALANDYSSQSNGPSIGDYVDQVMARTTGNAALFYTRNIDNSVNAQNQQNAALSQPKSDYGMGELTQAGAGDMSVPSMGEMQTPGSQQVGTKTENQLLGLDNMGLGTAQQGQSSPASTTPSNTRTEGNTLRMFGIHQAQSYLGFPYVWGGGGANGPSGGAGGQVGFDCSGLVQYVLGQAGINAPRLSYDQLAMGTRAPINSLQPGDLIGFGNGEHVAIWLGGGQIMEAPHTGESVRIRTLDPSENAWGVSLANLYH
jgi:cell wall-associated NlpC family hydrolase